MRVKNLSLLLHIDEISLHTLLEDQLTKNPNIESQASVPILGPIKIRFSQMELHGVKFAEEGIAVELASDVLVQVPRIARAVGFSGRLSLFGHLLLMVDPRGFFETSFSILDACWSGNPSLHLGTTCHPKERLQRLTDAILPRAEKKITQILAELISKEKIESTLADQLAPKGLVDKGDWHIQHLWISLQKVIISDGKLTLRVDLSVDLMQNMVPQQIALATVQFHSIESDIATQTLLEVSYQEVNQWIADNLTIINKQLTLPSDIESLIIDSKGGSFVCNLQLKASPESTFQILSILTLNRDLQLVELEKVEIRAAEETGFFVKAILRSTRRFIQSKIRKSFPISIKPLRSHLENLLSAHTPELVKSSIPKELLLQSMEFSDTSCSLVLDTQISLAMIDYRSTVTDPDLG